MKLAVHILGRQVAMLESIGDFKSVLTYDAGATASDFVSLTMPVRTESWVCGNAGCRKGGSDPAHRGVAGWPGARCSPV